MHSIDAIANLTATPHQHLSLTPRTSESFKRLGYTVEMIRKKTVKEINKKYGDSHPDPQITAKRVAHEQENQSRMIMELKNMRATIQEEMDAGDFHSPIHTSSQPNFNTRATSSSINPSTKNSLLAEC